MKTEILEMFRSEGQDRIDAFKSELKDLLIKYDAQIEIGDNGVNWDEHIPVFEFSLDGFSINFDITKTTIYPNIL